MCDEGKPMIGAIGWTDLTVEDAEDIRNFYQDVVGWKSTPFDMGGYNDFVMADPETDTPMAGICHARGPNAGLPPQWLIYISVEDVDLGAERCLALGCEVLVKPQEMGHMGRFCVIRDPAGAACALFTPAQGACDCEDDDCHHDHDHEHNHEHNHDQS